MKHHDAVYLLERYFKARYPLIALESHEETRLQNAIREIAIRTPDCRVYFWSIARGIYHAPFLLDQGPNQVFESLCHDPAELLENIRSYDSDEPTLFVLLDFHQFLKPENSYPLVIRQLRELFFSLSGTFHSIVMTGPDFTIPDDLKKNVTVIQWPLPDADLMGRIMVATAQQLPENTPVDIDGNGQLIINSMLGMTATEAESALLAAIVANKALDARVVPLIVKEKQTIIRQSGALEYYDTSETKMDGIGGLTYLKEYANRKRMTLLPGAQEQFVEPGRGVVIVGPPGVGKSAYCKAFAGGEIPLLRYDAGAAYNSLLGSSESNVRFSLRVAEAVAPSALWMDEIEKMMAQGGETDGGTSQRILATFLTWMQERTAPVFVIACANDVRSLRPEMLRRFDDIFFVDLPGPKARQEILKIHLWKRGLNPAEFNLEWLANVARGFSGAEIEKGIRSAVEMGMYHHLPVNNDRIIVAFQHIMPISKSMKDRIDGLRQWAQVNCISANDPGDTETEPETRGRQIQV